MTDPGYPILAREGWWHTASAVAVAMLVHFFAGYAWAIPFWIFAVFITQFFRDPPRQIPDLSDAVICPADGKVIALGEVDDPYLKRRAKRLSIFMNVFDVHSNRIPVTGKVRECWYSKGKFINASLDKASSENERNAMWITTDQDQDVIVVQVAGLIARRILCYVQSGKRVTRGDRYGFIRFGSRVDVYLPLNAHFMVSLGDKVKGAAGVIAQFK